MLMIFSSGEDRTVTAEFVCDDCGGPIEEEAAAAAVFAEETSGPGPRPVLHVHHGRCRRRAEKRVRPDGPAAWHDLPYHLGQVREALAATAFEVADGGAESVDLSPGDREELRRRFSDLADWLCERGLPPGGLIRNELRRAEAAGTADEAPPGRSAVHSPGADSDGGRDTFTT